MRAGRLVLSFEYTRKGGFFATVGLAGLATHPLDLLLIRCWPFEGCLAPVSRAAVPPPLGRTLGFGFPALEAEAGAVALFGTVRRRLFLLSLFILLAARALPRPNDTKMVWIS
jgi:hypothetical protein